MLRVRAFRRPVSAHATVAGCLAATMERHEAMQSHYIDGRPYDRLMFDILASEHRELRDERRLWTQGSHREANREQRQAQPG